MTRMESAQVIVLLNTLDAERKRADEAMAITFEQGDRNIELVRDRDRYKERCEALERAIKTKLTACSTCAKKPDEGYCDELYDCINAEWSYPHWEFDEARFAKEAGE